MDVASVAIVVAALCVNFGWQPSQDDPQAYEVLMQVEPHLVDALHDSPEMAIESHVPASITPIRNIRVVVGTGEPPRTFIAAKSAVKPADRVVRGQEPAPVERTTKFQNDDSWSGDRYATPSGSGRQYDALGATIGAEPKGTADANPWTRDSSQNASRDFGQELQNMSGLGGPTSAPPATRSGSTAKRWPAPPPTAAPQSTTTAPVASAATNSAITPNTWTSIRPEFAPPRLTTPPLPSGLRVASNPATTRPTAGPTFPAPPTSAAPPLHSVLSNPAATSQTAEQDWSAVWGSGTSTNSAADDVGSGMVPVLPRPQTTARTKPQTSTSEQSAFDRWPTTATAPATISNHTPSPDQSIGDRYGQPRPGRPIAETGADEWANFGRQPTDNSIGSGQPTIPATAPFSVEPQNRTAAETVPSIATQTPAPVAGQNVAASGEEVPWKPLLGVSLALAGSVGANFFLGMSYADARRRYRSLVAKTTHAFQKEAGIAA